GPRRCGEDRDRDSRNWPRAQDTAAATAGSVGPQGNRLKCVSTLSDLVEAHGNPDEENIAWLHALVSDLQLLADLAFADIVVWVPTRTQSFVAVAHARPSSAATLFYRDFVGQEIKSDWRSQVTEAFVAGQIIDNAAPDWFEETPTRVRAVPVIRKGVAAAPIAVLTRHTNLSEALTPGRQELTFNDCANDLFSMIATGDFPEQGTPTGRKR